MLLSKEHYELMAQFEKMYKKTMYGGRFDKESKELWSKGVIYQDGVVNQVFLMFRQGYELGKAVERTNEP